MLILLSSKIGSSFQSFIQLVGTLLIFLFILLCAYLTSRWMGGFQKAHMTNRNLKLVETIRVGNNKMISIVQTGCKYVVVSIGKDEVHFLCELKEEELLEKISEAPDTLIPMNDTFQKIFDKFKG